ncbi:MAG: HAMP domain-containing histidine kinase [Candidatus Kapabacteria bacterium]|nr:HAMP domain-containing histidine kinase [Candidatus Kapabacteria bacterium]
MRQARPDRIRIFRASVTKWQIKVLLSLAGLCIMAGVLYHTKTIVDELVSNERRTVELYANLLARSYQNATDEELLYYIDQAYSSIHFPVILTGRDGTPIYPYQQYMINVELDTTLTIDQQKTWLSAYIEEMRREYSPFQIKDPNGKVVLLMFYSNSEVVRKLRYMPFIEILAVGAFILLGYLVFSSIRRDEQSNIWVGMAKEAAHQLGTPLSSLMAWLEILRLNKESPESIDSTAQEMEQDINRLSVIAHRFAKIGAQPKMSRVPVAEILDQACQYFEKRLPNLGKRVTLVRDFDRSLHASINEELFEWVIENLIRNAVDALERHDGVIEIQLARRSKGGVIVTVKDNGKGMTRQIASKIFEPGYTTKKRGWGLGLSLSKRIIEDYHGGRIYVRETQPGVGTTFAIEVPEL